MKSQVFRAAKETILEIVIIASTFLMGSSFLYEANSAAPFGAAATTIGFLAGMSAIGGSGAFLLRKDRKTKD